jgi:glycosyltransferase involved in cell wall biosynthesis
MNIINLVNSESITSVPARWTDYLYKNRLEFHTSLVELKHIKKICVFKKNKTIIHGHHVKSMTVFLFFNFFYKHKNIYTVHGSYRYLSKVNRILFNFVISNTDHVVFVNAILYDQLPTKLKRKISKKHQIIFNGVESDYKFEKIDVFKKFNFSNDLIYLFHPARFVEEKNHLNVLEGFSLANKKNNKLRLILAGEGKLRLKIEAKIKDLNLVDKVSLIGLITKDEVYNFYQNADVFIMPSVSEGLNVSFLEALSMNCKIVVSNINQFTQPVVSSKYSFKELNITLTDPDDKHSISESLLNSVSTHKLNLKDNPFSIDNMINSYLNLYQKLL